MRAALTATVATLFALLFAAPASAVVLQPGDIVVADPNAFGGSGGLIDVNPTTGSQTAISSNAISNQDLFADPSSVAFLSDGTLAVADPNAFGGTGGLIRVDPGTGQESPLSSNQGSLGGFFADPTGVAVDSFGRLIVADSNAGGGSGAVIRVDPASGQQTLLSSNAVSSTDLFTRPVGVTIERNGTILVADADSPAPTSASKGAIIAVDPSSGQQKLVTNNDTSNSALFSSPLGVAVETPGTLLVANTSADSSQNGVILVNRSSGQQYALATDAGFAAPTGITIDLDGNALIADAEAFGGNGGVIRVNPAGGQRSTVSGNPNAPGALFEDPSGMTVIPPSCQGLYATIVGTQGADAITGTPAPDVISARGGDDIVDGGGGADLICGDEGRDRMIGHDGKDRMLGGPQGDVILGGNGKDVAKGEFGRDKVDGGKGNDKLYGQQQRDFLVGGKGRDLLKGGPGRDALTGGPARDRLRGGPGKDKLKQ